MPKIYEHRLTVPPEAVDGNGHVNNVEYIRWMQDAAVRHSTAQGWSPERYQSTGATWFVRTHEIEYLRPAFADDAIMIRTWVADFRKVRSRRKYRFLRESDGKVLVRAVTDWVFVDIGSGRPCAIPDELRNAFIVVAPEDEP